jgi:adenine/guanine phosphoribosyltransferase-like PRPP-binding protein
VTVGRGRRVHECAHKCVGIETSGLTLAMAMALALAGRKP